MGEDLFDATDDVISLMEELAAFAISTVKEAETPSQGEMDKEGMVLATSESLKEEVSKAATEFGGHIKPLQVDASSSASSYSASEEDGGSNVASDPRDKASLEGEADVAGREALARKDEIEREASKTWSVEH